MVTTGSATTGPILRFLREGLGHVREGIGEGERDRSVGKGKKRQESETSRRGSAPLEPRNISAKKGACAFCVELELRKENGALRGSLATLELSK